MECNKEEAIRAKDIAGKKMQKKDQKPPPTLQTQPANPKTNKTFWTMCSFCYTKFQYYMDVLNKSLHCKFCLRPFVAYDIGAKGIPPRTKNDTNAACPLQGSPSYGFFKVKSQRANDNISSIGDFQRKFGSKDSVIESFWKTRCPPEASVASKTGGKCESVDLKFGGKEESYKVKQSTKLSRRTREQVRKTCDAGRRDPDDMIIEKGDIPPPSINESSKVQPQSAGDFQGKVVCKDSRKESFRKRECTPKAQAASRTCGKRESVDAKIDCEEKSNKIVSNMVNRKRRVHDETIIEKDCVIPQSTNGSSKEHYPRRSPCNKHHVSRNEQFDHYPKRAKRSMLPSFNDDKNVDKTSEMNSVHALSSTTEENKNDGTQSTMAFEESLSHGNIDTKETNGERAEDSGIKICSENEDESLKVERMKMIASHGLAAITEENEKNGVWEKKAAGESLFKGNSKIKSDKKGTVDNVMRNFSEAVNSSASNVSKPELEIKVLAMPEFSNFCRGDKCFENGQIWACYDDSWDGMPRFYGRIERVFFPGFRVQISWLDPNLDDKDEIEWVNEILPVSCGKFMVRSTTDSIEDPFAFSHFVSWDKGCMGKSFDVYPKTGEIWALYKDWDIKWKSGRDRMRTVQYEYVEVLSDYVEGLGTCVAKLGKLKDFTCLFCKLVQGSHSYFQIPSTELYRFSHQVPSYKMTGEEREDVPRGSFELDPGSLPLNLTDIPVVENYEMEMETTIFNGSCQDLPIGMGFNGGANQVEKEDNSNVAKPEPEIKVLAMPEFSNFYRGDKCFENGQIWACYDDSWDGMPRFYARIERVFSPGFKVQISWLDANPGDKDEIEWVNEELPVSCGKFVVRSTTDSIEDPSTFSHLVSWDKGCMGKSFDVYPKTGEIWALYKDWDIKWKSGRDRMRTVEYEYVEVLSDYVEGLGACVAKLGKLKDFTCLFCKLVQGSHSYFQIPSTELYRFSHQVPSYKMTGEEREDVPRGSFELDPGSLPLNLADIPVVENYEMEMETTIFNGSCQDLPIGMDFNRGAIQVEKEDNSNIKDQSSNNVQKSAEADYPDAEFYDFDADRSKEQFQAGQIWALYCVEDAMPKYYCLIKKIKSHPNFEVQVEWLTVCLLKDMVPWRDEKMPMSCGKFFCEGDEPQVYAMTSAFSHPVRADFKKGECVIVPRKGEVWALYKQWNVNMTCSDLLNCEYEIVEIHEVKHMWRKVLVLERVAGFNTVFKVQVRKNKLVTMEIPGRQMLRFSHLIPSFRLRKERDGSLNGFWELDPASLPVAFFKPI